MTSRAYCFTLNNPTEELDFVELKNGVYVLYNGVRYVIYQEELGESGTHHFQGYIELSSPMRISQLKAFPGLERAHFEMRRGTRDEARDYCRKLDATVVSGPREFGNWIDKGQGARSDLVSLYQDLKSGETDLALLDKYPAQFMRMYRGISIARLVRAGVRDWKTEVHLYFGQPGTGKSRLARDLYPSAFWKHPTSKWWDNYSGQAEVVWDDFGKASCPYSELLRLLDRYPLTVETKGGSVNFAARTLILTSNSLPHLWYYYDQRMLLSAVVRRIDKFILFRPRDFDPTCPDVERLHFSTWEEVQQFFPIPLLPARKENKNSEN